MKFKVYRSDRDYVPVGTIVSGVLMPDRKHFRLYERHAPAHWPAGMLLPLEGNIWGFVAVKDEPEVWKLASERLTNALS